MNEWVSIKIGYPQNGEEVEIIVHDRKTTRDYQLKAKFIDDEFHRSWEFQMLEGTDIVHLPTYWRRLTNELDERENR